MGSLIPLFLGYTMRKIYLILFTACWAPTSNAAPLDALLTASPHNQAGEIQLELALDAVNSTLDVFGIRAKDPVYGGTTVGDYSGLHLRGGYGITDRLWVDASAWKRRISYRGDTEQITTWQTAAQYRLTNENRDGGQFAVRLGAWGDAAPVVNKSTPTAIQGITLQSVSVDKPRDVQVQADLIGSWLINSHTQLSTFVGMGASRVSVGALTGKVNGCNYNIVSTSLATTASLNSPCGGLVSATVYVPNAPQQWLSYNSRYYQAGGQLQWVRDKWQLSAGYQFQYLNRQQIDNAIEQHGGIAYKNNHTVIAELARSLGGGVIVFARGQAMSNQFVGELPFSYNSLSATKFGRLYGFATVGARLTF
jgi:hypothetical protein